MEEKIEHKIPLCVGLLAHVDAGKTTLSESLLYQCGVLKKLGRVDNRNSFLDTEELERKKGITIFSKQAILESSGVKITLLDTPGHVDFSAEMERTLWIMDYAILVVNASDGIQGHTLTLWKLLKRYQIPVFLFVNKMDQVGVDKKRIMMEIKKEFGEGCIDFMMPNSDDFLEQIAVCDDELLEKYLDTNLISVDNISSLIKERKIFPCYFGSALKMEEIDTFLNGILLYMKENPKKKEFGARIFKIMRDPQGNRITYMKITSGSLKVKNKISGVIFKKLKFDASSDMSAEWEEKVNQIRIYSGEKYEMVQEVRQGEVCAVTGLTKTYPGEGLGIEKDVEFPVLEPVLSYTLIPPEDVDVLQMLEILKEIEEEQPEIQIQWQEQSNTIQIKLMGEVQIDVLKELIERRFRVKVDFGTANIVYKETIRNTVEGVGHFEPLRHYAEVHLLLEPGELGSGIQFFTDCSEDLLNKNWQRLILTHLEEKEHIGVLTGSTLTDLRITIVGGKAHTKHTEGGDFRKATYRALRQGLMEAENVLLEPYYSFHLELPIEMIGRAMTDVENMYGKSDLPITQGEVAILDGVVPVSTMRGYQLQVNTYTKGRGILTCSFIGYGPCHNEDEVIEEIGYHADQDNENPSSSVFCAHGAGFIVPWDQVKRYMHVNTEVLKENIITEELSLRKQTAAFQNSIDEEQIEEIFNRTFHANQNFSKKQNKTRKVEKIYKYRGQEKIINRKRYLIVDGYNIVHAWDELKCLVNENLQGARMKLLDILSNYQGFVKSEIIVVFDAYKVKGNIGELYEYENIHVVFTKEAETADTYIERLAHEMSHNYEVTVATSDALVQLITRGQNCMLMSARELKDEIERVNEKIRIYIEESNKYVSLENKLLQ